jgi:hypothetical protein
MASFEIMEGEGMHSVPLAYTPGTWNAYEVDLTADAIAHFTTGGADSLRGEDNSLGLLNSQRIWTELTRRNRTVYIKVGYAWRP